MATKKKTPTRFPAKFELVEFAEAVMSLESAASLMLSISPTMQDILSGPEHVHALALWKANATSLEHALAPFQASRQLRNAEPEPD